MNSLEITGGVMRTAFHPLITDYEMYVVFGTGFVTVQATTLSTNVTYSVNGSPGPSQVTLRFERERGWQSIVCQEITIAVQVDQSIEMETTGILASSPMVYSVKVKCTGDEVFRYDIPHLNLWQIDDMTEIWLGIHLILKRKLQMSGGFTKNFARAVLQYVDPRPLIEREVKWHWRCSAEEAPDQDWVNGPILLSEGIEQSDVLLAIDTEVVSRASFHTLCPPVSNSQGDLV